MVYSAAEIKFWKTTNHFWPLEHLSSLFDFIVLPGMKKLLNVFQGIFLFSFIWSVGASTDADGREKFNRLLHAILDGILGEAMRTEYCITECDLPMSKSMAVPLPHLADVYSWRFVKEGQGR